jgi:S-layer homology domain
MPTTTETETACVVPFTDTTASDWFYGYMEYLYCHSVIIGYSTNPPCVTGLPCFNPGGTTTRGQIAKIITLGFGLPVNTSGGPHFSDVQPGSTFYTYIETLYNLGILDGYADGTFRVGAPVTRGQIAKIAVNAAIISDPQHWVLLGPPTNTFEDVPVGSTYFRYIETAVVHRVLSGYPCGTSPAGPCAPPLNRPYFLPDTYSSRAQITKIVFLAITYPALR